MSRALLPGDVFAGAIGETRAASTAGGGTALTTAAALIVIPDGAQQIELIARNFSTAVVAKYALNPYLAVLKTTDNLATITDYSENAQDGSTATDVTLSSLGTAAQGDYLYVGSHLPFRGVKIDVDAANGNASALTVNYWNGTAWTDISETDGTASGGATMAQDGDITWTVPAAWAKKSLAEIADPTPAMAITLRDEPLYWTRWEVSAALDSSVTLNSMLPLNRSTAYAEMVATFKVEVRTHKGIGGVSCVEALTDAGTANLIVNAMTRMGAAGIDL